MSRRADTPLVQLSSRGQVTLPSSVRQELGLDAGDAFRVLVEDDRIVLEPVEVLPVELYTKARIQEFLASAEMTGEELDRARALWEL